MPDKRLDSIERIPPKQAILSIESTLRCIELSTASIEAPSGCSR